MLRFSLEPTRTRQCTCWQLFCPLLTQEEAQLSQDRTSLGASLQSLEAQLQNIPGEIRLRAQGSNGRNKCELALSGVLALQLILCDHRAFVVPESQTLVIESCCKDPSGCL